MSRRKFYHRGRRHVSAGPDSSSDSEEWLDEGDDTDWSGYISDADDWDDYESEEGFRTPKQVKDTRKRRKLREKRAVREKKKKARKQKRGSRIIGNIILAAAVIVFCISAYQLFHILYGYHEGRKEYNEVKNMAVTGKAPSETAQEEGEKPFSVDFDALTDINPDTVGWIRFYPEPAQISYPLVQTTDNSTYLDKTFSSNDNTVGAIFVNAYNHPDFNDRNTIIYGHRMNDSSMFHDLAEYEKQSFWEANPYFYIYTPDGREITYHIYAAGEVTETSDSYLTDFADDQAYQDFLDYTKQASAYDTQVEVTTEDQVVTLSTCTRASDEHRMVVVGVKESEKQVD